MTVYTDSFTDTNGTLLNAHTSDSGPGWTLASADNNGAIQSNALLANGTANPTVYLYNSTPPTADYSVQAVLLIQSDSGSGVIGRADAIGTTYYQARYFKSLNQWQLFSTVAGASTTLGTYSETVTAGTTRTVKLTMAGTTITLLVDGVSQISVTNSAITAAGKAGLRLTKSTSATVDSFSLNDGYTPTPDTIAVTDSNLVSGCTPHNWIVSGSSLWTVHTPAGLQFSFSGTALAVNIDVSAMSAYSATSYPVIVYSVDNGAFTQVQLTSSTTAITLASGLSAGTHTVDIWQTKTSSTGDNWTPTNGLKITSFSVSSGGATVSRTLPTRRALIYGDSITRGRGMDDSVLPGGNGLHAWSMGLAAALDPVRSGPSALFLPRSTESVVSAPEPSSANACAHRSE